MIIASASSKTAIGAAYLLAQREDVELVGLTSPRNAEFVEGLGIYDRTVTYDAIGSLERGPATLVDIAGDGDVRLAVHTHFGDDLAYSMTVGVTHWEELGAGGGAELPGPQPAIFFAPDRVEKRSEDWGAAALGRAGRRGLARLQRLGRRLAGGGAGRAASRLCRAPISRCSRATWRPTGPT